MRDYKMTGLKIICINNINKNVYPLSKNRFITLDKTYEILFTIKDNDTLYFYVINDNGYTDAFPDYFFISIDEYREEQLNKLLNE